MHKSAVAHGAERCLRHLFLGYACVDFNVVAHTLFVRHQLCDDVPSIRNHPRWRHRYHPAGLRTAGLKAVKKNLGAVSLLVVLDTKPIDFGVKSLRYSLLRGLDLGTLLLRSANDVEPPQVSMQAIGLRSEA